MAEVCVYPLNDHPLSPLVMQWIYKLQQYVAITTTEAWALLTLLGLLTLGIVAQQVFKHTPSVPADQYASLDAEFEQLSTTPRSVNTVVPAYAFLDDGVLRIG